MAKKIQNDKDRKDRFVWKKGDVVVVKKPTKKTSRRVKNGDME